MKKVSYFLFLLIVFLMSFNEVNASENECYVYDSSGNKTDQVYVGCTKLCQYYTVTEEFSYTKNYINSTMISSSNIIEIWLYGEDEYQVYATNTSAYNSNFTSEKDDINSIKNVIFTDSSFTTCPDSAYYDTMGASDEVCFGSSCLSTNINDPYYDSGTYFGVVGYVTSTKTYDYNNTNDYSGYVDDTYGTVVNTCAYENGSIEDYSGDGSNVYTINLIDGKYYYYFPTYNYTLEVLNNSSLACVSGSVFKFCMNYYDGTHLDETNGTGTYVNPAIIYSSGTCDSYYESELEEDTSGDYEVEEEDTNVLFGTIDCESDGFLGSPTNPGDTAYYLQLALEIMRYIAIVALIALSSVDYAKAVSSGDADALKKANKTVIKRLIYTVLLFIFPIILKVVFNITGIYGTVDPFCGLS